MKARSLIWWFLTAKAKREAEAESRGWVAVCPHCGLETSVWDMGGLRYKSTKGGRSWTGGRCRRCGRLSMHPMVWKPDLADAARREIEARAG